MITPLYWKKGSLFLLDQTRLPREEVWLRLTSYQKVAQAIRAMQVRGAPAIGIAAAYGIVLGMHEGKPNEDRTARFAKITEELRQTRPTAVNLFWAIDRLKRVFEAYKDADDSALNAALLAEAKRIHDEDIAANQSMGEYGTEILPQNARVLTICNTGALATGGYGTALGVVRTAWKQGKIKMVYACETRPLLQGARLTAWELGQEKIPFRLIVDSAAGYLMAKGEIDAVLAGADRIAQNGDTANKIGTYTLAVLAHRHGIPFYVVAPFSTIDVSLTSGAEIPIEERSAAEITRPFGLPIAPVETQVWNPAFDVTPAELITGIVTERGVLRPPYHITK